MKTDLIKCVAIDDDPGSLKIIELLIKRIPFLELVSSFGDPLNAVDFLLQAETPLVFLDIEMPNLTGLELISTLKHNPSVIVISSKREYAFDAFALNVVDYLAKPLTDYARFFKATLKAKEGLQAIKPVSVETDHQLFIKIDSSLHNLNLNTILWVEAFGDYIKINTADKVMITLATMKSMESKMPENLFARVHRSFLVNIRKINHIDLGNIQIGSKTLPVSSFYRDALMKKISLL
jgi:DNA-binding LytR/AlgR family response regulator